MFFMFVIFIGDIDFINFVYMFDLDVLRKLVFVVYFDLKWYLDYFVN